MSTQKSSNHTVTGIACGMGAGALWGLVFLAPELLRDFSPLQMTIGRYLAYGVISAMLILPVWQKVRARIERRDWLALAGLAFCGNTLYYILLSAAIQMGGIAMTSLIIGFLPVAVTIIGSRDHGAVPLKNLTPSLLLCVAGVVCIAWQGLAATGHGTLAVRAAGLLCAVGALVSWTGYAVGNSRCLARLDGISSHEWSLLTGCVTGAQSLILTPLSLMLDKAPHTLLAWSWLAGVSVSVALLASIAGNALWNRMSRLLPLTMVGQMILFETLFALIYGLVWEKRWPTPLEAAAFLLVTLSVTACIAAHKKPGSHTTQMAE